MLQGEEILLVAETVHAAVVTVHAAVVEVVVAEEVESHQGVEVKVG